MIQAATSDDIRLSSGGTRVGFGPDYGENNAQETVANSNYNARETTLRCIGKRSSFLLGYTYGSPIDRGSNLGEQLKPLDLRGTRAVSAFDSLSSRQCRNPLFEIAHWRDQTQD
jgi:hypothetical protein